MAKSFVLGFLYILSTTSNAIIAAKNSRQQDGDHRQFENHAVQRQGNAALDTAGRVVDEILRRRDGSQPPALALETTDCLFDLQIGLVPFDLELLALGDTESPRRA